MRDHRCSNTLAVIDRDDVSVAGLGMGDERDGETGRKDGVGDDALMQSD